MRLGESAACLFEKGANLSGLGYCLSAPAAIIMMSIWVDAALHWHPWAEPTRTAGEFNAWPYEEKRPAVRVGREESDSSFFIGPGIELIGENINGYHD